MKPLDHSRIHDREYWRQRQSETDHEYIMWRARALNRQAFGSVLFWAALGAVVFFAMQGCALQTAESPESIGESLAPMPANTAEIPQAPMDAIPPRKLPAGCWIGYFGGCGPESVNQTVSCGPSAGFVDIPAGCTMGNYCGESYCTVRYEFCCPKDQVWSR